jgi:hypothetical protein
MPSTTPTLRPALLKGKVVQFAAAFGHSTGNI